MAAYAYAYASRTRVATAVRACAANELEAHPMRVRGWNRGKEGLLLAFALSSGRGCRDWSGGTLL